MPHTAPQMPSAVWRSAPSLNAVGRKSRKATEASRASVSLPRRVARNDGWEAVAVMSGHRDVADRRARGARTSDSADEAHEPDGQPDEHAAHHAKDDEGEDERQQKQQ